MSKLSIDVFFGRKLYFVLALVISGPVYIVIHSYVDSIHIHEDEAVGFAATVCFVLGIFSGRYISQVWASKLTSYPTYVLTALVSITIISIAWLFFHADFPLTGRTSVNMVLFWLPLMLISINLGILIKVVHTVTQNQLGSARRMAEHSKTELHLLQSQLSPHFLFNTLNNLYGLSISSHEKIPPLLLKLSELLRYSVYDVSEPYVSLNDEMAYIKNYIEFEKIRLEDRLMLTTDFEALMDPAFKIAPMLLIIFIENAFKHSKNTSTPEIFIDIRLKIWAGSILFSVRNSYGKEIQPDNLLNKSSGLGLQNVRKRLELLYPGAYELHVNSDETFYNVDLQLKIK